jgi:hypothetical protein
MEPMATETLARNRVSKLTCVVGGALGAAAILAILVAEPHYPKLVTPGLYLSFASMFLLSVSAVSGLIFPNKDLSIPMSSLVAATLLLLIASISLWGMFMAAWGSG